MSKPKKEENKSTEEVVLEVNELICLLTGDIKKNSNKEKTLQSLIRILNEEYGFDLENMARDFNLIGYDPDTEKNKKQKVELVFFLMTRHTKVRYSHCLWPKIEPFTMKDNLSTA